MGYGNTSQKKFFSNKRPKKRGKLEKAAFSLGAVSAASEDSRVRESYNAGFAYAQKQQQGKIRKPYL
jgi:hypothetical protein